MASKQPSRRQMRQVAGELGPGDGIDPRLASAGSGRPRGGRKTAQLCRQVADALALILAEQPDEVLQGLYVAAVDPAPDESNLLVTLAPGPGAATRDAGAILERLHQAAGLLRTEVASSITRRKAPGLSYRVAPG
jgi:ribosome-binding factor A